MELNSNEIEKVQRLMQSTWQYIGGDMAAMNEGKPMKQKLVIEVVLDAGYIESYAAQKPEEKELMKRFRQLPYKDQIKVAKGTFTYKWYE